MDEFIRTLPNTFIPLFVAIDVFWVLFIFAAFTVDTDAAEKNRIINQSVITALIVSLAFTALGEIIFRIIGIEVTDFKIAGGLLLLALAVRDLLLHGSKGLIEKSETSGVVPLGVPLIVGPAVLTTIIVLVDHYGVISTVISLILNLLLVWVSMKWSHVLAKTLGKNAIIALSKIMAILLASIAIMMIRLGIESILLKCP